jgi:hypothetical protein
VSAILPIEVVGKSMLAMLAVAAFVVPVQAGSCSRGAGAGATPHDARYGLARSADRTVLAWQDETGRLRVVRPDREPKVLLSEGEDVYNEGIRFWDWAPRGHLLVANFGLRLLVVDAQTGRRREVTPIGDPAAKYLEPLWSPAGDLIAYTRQAPRGGGCDSVDIGVAPANGGSFRVVNLFQPTVQDRRNSGGLGCGGGRVEEALVNTALTYWSPDGKTLAVPRKGSSTGKPLRAIEVGSAGSRAGTKVIAALMRRLR